jgi:hypothetical protein
MTTSPIDAAKNHAADAVDKVAPFVARFAPLGYAAKGVVYVIVGVMSALAAAGGGGDTPGSRGALEALIRQPFGMVLLGVVAAGLVCYAMWQFMRAIEDPDRKGSDAKGIALRFGFFISGIIHLGLVLAAVRLIMGTAGAGGDEDEGTRSWSAWAMSYPFGRWIIAVIGVGIVGYGLSQLWKAYRAKLDDQLVLSKLSKGPRRGVVATSRFGLAARGIVFGVIGLFLLIAAYQHDPNEARGLAGALRALREQPYGPWILGIVALGLISYGVYQFVEAKYRRIGTR